MSKSYSDSDLSNFLNLIQQLESSGGQNTAHRTIASGIHEGDSAYGSRALMPNTVSELANRRRLDNTNDPVDDQLIKGGDDNVKSLLTQYPDKSTDYEKQLAQMVLQKNQGDPYLASTAWLYGHNQSPTDLQTKLSNDPQYKNRIDNVIDQQAYSSKPDEMVDQLTNMAKDNKFKSLQSLISRK